MLASEMKGIESRMALSTFFYLMGETQKEVIDLDSLVVACIGRGWLLRRIYSVLGKKLAGRVQ